MSEVPRAGVGAGCHEHQRGYGGDLSAAHTGSCSFPGQVCICVCVCMYVKNPGNSRVQYERGLKGLSSAVTREFPGLKNLENSRVISVKVLLITQTGDVQSVAFKLLRNYNSQHVLKAAEHAGSCSFVTAGGGYR